MMQRHVLSAAIGLWWSAVAGAQPLTTQSALPTGVNLGGAAFTSPTHGFLVGDNHTLVETHDGGLTWVTRMNTGLSTDPFYTIVFADAAHGYIAGNNQDAYRTIDGGATWLPMGGMASGSVRALDFVAATIGFAGYNGALTHTSDGGQTWQVRGQYPDCPIMYGMDFRDGAVGLCGGGRSTPWHDSGIYRTEDGGWTWALVHAGGVNDVLWISETSALAIDGELLMRSDDEGRTWVGASFTPIDTGLSEFTRVGTTERLAGVSGKGDIWLSWDMGLSWTKVVTGIGVLPASWSISFLDDQNGWVAGANGLAYRTADGGETWELMNSGCGDEVTGIDFVDETHGMAVTRNGFVFRTTDGGRKWRVSAARVTGLVFGRTEGLHTVDMVDQYLAYIGGPGGVVFVTYDGGENWNSVGFPWTINGNYTINDIEAVDEGTVYATGNFGNSDLLKSWDGGFTWEEVGGPMGYGVAVEAKGSRVWVATGGNVVDRSFDSGQTWTRTGVSGDFVTITDMEFHDQNVGYLTSFYGYLAKTTNGGVTWTTTERAQNETYLSLSVVSATEVWVVGYDSSTIGYFYLRTTNGGATWTRTNFALGYAEAMSRVHASPAGRVWFGGNIGRIQYRGAPALTVSLPTVPPSVVPPGAPAEIPVRVVAGDETVASADLMVRASAAGAYQRIGMTTVDGENYVATLPAFACGDTPQYYIEARGDLGTVVRHPATAPGNVLAVRVGVFETGVLMGTDFAGGLPAGWSATGLWHVGTACAPPGACGSGGARAYFGLDATCRYNTGARAAGILRSPTVAMPTLEAGQTIRLTFCSALDNEYPDNALGDDDQAILWWVSGAGQAPLDWMPDHAALRTRVYDLSAYAGQSGRLEWRFDTMNTYMNDFRGWHVDDVRLEGPMLACVPPADPCDPDFNRDGVADQEDVAYLVNVIAGGANPTGRDADFDGDGVADQSDYAALVNVIAGGACP